MAFIQEIIIVHGDDGLHKRRAPIRVGFLVDKKKRKHICCLLFALRNNRQV